MAGIHLLKLLMIFLLFAITLINMMNYSSSAPAQSTKLINNSPSQSKNRLAQLKFPNNGAPENRGRGVQDARYVQLIIV